MGAPTQSSVPGVTTRVEVMDYHDGESFGHAVAEDPSGALLGRLDFGARDETVYEVVDADGQVVLETTDGIEAQHATWAHLEGWPDDPPPHQIRERTRSVIHVKWIEVDESAQRRGIGRALVEALKREYPDHEIDPGMVTDEGAAAFWDRALDKVAGRVFDVPVRMLAMQPREQNPIFPSVVRNYRERYPEDRPLEVTLETFQAGRRRRVRFVDGHAPTDGERYFLIIDGHHRALAAHRDGRETVPAMRVDVLSQGDVEQYGNPWNRPIETDDDYDWLKRGQVDDELPPLCLDLDGVGDPGSWADGNELVAALSPSEAVYGVLAWLTTRDEPITMGSVWDASPAADAASAFCEANDLPPPRDEWAQDLIHPVASDIEPPYPDRTTGGHQVVRWTGADGKARFGVVLEEDAGEFKVRELGQEHGYRYVPRDLVRPLREGDIVEVPAFPWDQTRPWSVSRKRYGCCAGHRNPAVRLLIALAKDDTNQVAGLVIRRSDGKILLIRREPNDTRPGEWEGPGGHIKADENAVKGAAREALEEVGSLPDDLKVVGHEHYPLDGGGSYTNVYVETASEDWTPDLSGEHDDWGWFAVNDLPAKTNKGMITAIGDSPWVTDPEREVRTADPGEHRAASDPLEPVLVDPHGVLRVVCAWCGKELPSKPSGSDQDDVSHGMCEECGERMLNDAYPGRRKAITSLLRRLHA